jgi:GDP-D-mannose 3',5'-epimerase
VTTNDLVDIAGVTLTQRQPVGAQGVWGRNGDNTLIQERLGWSPSITFEKGLRNTDKWIFDQMSEGAPAIVR